MLGNRRQPGVLYFGVFLVGVLTIKQKTQKHDLKKSFPGFITTLLPTVKCIQKKAWDGKRLSIIKNLIVNKRS
jgi:hypothetical protein